MSGRPSKRTPEREAKILQVLEAGNTRRAACQYVGIDENTLSRWVTTFVDFADRVRKAEAAAEVQCLAVIRQGIRNGDTADAKWWLERRRPDDYARRDKIDLDVYVRERARELGIDEDEALSMVKPYLKLTG